MAFTTPSDYAAGILAAWHDPSIAANITAPSGSITLDNDLSSQGYNEGQNTAGARPTYPGATIGGLNTEAFAGGQCFTSGLPQPTSTQIFTLIWLVQTNNMSSEQALFATDGGGACNTSINSNGLLALNKQFYSGIGLSTSPVQLNKPTIVVSCYDSNTGDWFFRINGNPAGSGNTPGVVFQGYGSVIGSGFASAGNADFKGVMGERLILYSRSLTDITNGEGYVGWRWDGGSAGYLVSQFPSDHPYKNAKPGGAAVVAARRRPSLIVAS